MACTFLVLFLTFHDHIFSPEFSARVEKETTKLVDFKGIRKNKNNQVVDRGASREHFCLRKSEIFRRTFFSVAQKRPDFSSPRRSIPVLITKLNRDKAKTHENHKRSVWIHKRFRNTFKADRIGFFLPPWNFERLIIWLFASRKKNYPDFAVLWCGYTNIFIYLYVYKYIAFDRKGFFALAGIQKWGRRGLNSSGDFDPLNIKTIIIVIPCISVLVPFLAQK